MAGKFKYILLSVFLGSSLMIGGASAGLARPPLQDGAGVHTITHDQTGFLTFVGVDTGARGAALPGAMAFQSGRPTAATAMADISVYAREFGINNPSQELRLKQSLTIPGSSATFRYQQVYQGIPVVAGEMLANYDGRGCLSALAGETSPKLTLSVTPKITADTALSLALEYVAKDSGVPPADLSGSAPALWIYDPRLLQQSDFPARLVWRTEIIPAQGHLPIRYLVLVDARLPTIALAFNQADTFWSERAVEAGIADDPERSTSESPASLPLLAPYHDDPPGLTYNSHYYADRQGVGHSTLVCNTVPSALSGAGSCDGTNEITDSNRAQYFAYDTVNYYDSRHHRNSIDDNGMTLISNVYYSPGGGASFFNAFWDGVQMTYGAGDRFTADDIVAHELTHGVTEHASNLFYYYESGAINEMFSDVFGELVDQWNGINSRNEPDSPDDKWIIGEEFSYRDVFARSLKNPPDYGQPDRTQSPFYYRDQEDNGGVHFNSGVGNKAAYLIAEGGTFNGYAIRGLGRDKMSAIFYETNMFLLTSGADYEILGAALVQACHNLRAGANPLAVTEADCGEVDKAVHATEMQLDPVAGVDFTPKASVCTGPTDVPVYLFYDDLEAGAGNFASGTLVNTGTMPSQWAWVEASSVGVPYAVSGTKSLFGVNHPVLYGYDAASYESFLTLNQAVTLPPDSSYHLYFNHAVALEAERNDDGAVLEYSVDGGDWTDALPLYEAGQNYTAAINATNNPLVGRLAFTRESHGYVSSRYNLSSLAGHQVNFRWLIGANDVRSTWGWFLDDIQVYQCIRPEIAIEGPDGMIPNGGALSFGSTTQNNPATRTITVRNTGTNTLNLYTDPPTMPAGFAATSFGSAALAPGESTTAVLTCLANAPGAPVRGTVTMNSNDGDDNPFMFTVNCTVKASALSAAPARNAFTTPTVTLTWNRVLWAVDYEVQVSRFGTFAYRIPVVIDPATRLSAVVSGLEDGLYYWRVRAIRANGTAGAWSRVETFTIDLP